VLAPTERQSEAIDPRNRASSRRRPTHRSDAAGATLKAAAITAVATIAAITWVSSLLNLGPSSLTFGIVSLFVVSWWRWNGNVSRRRG